jgi:hypothetical protein
VLVLRNTSVGVVKIKPQERNQGAVAQNEKVVPSVANGAGKERVAIDPMLEYFALKEDDGKSPWTPPTIGSPYSTDMLPMGIETLVFLSGAAIEPKKPVDQLLQWWQGVQATLGADRRFGVDGTQKGNLREWAFADVLDRTCRWPASRICG